MAFYIRRWRSNLYLLVGIAALALVVLPSVVDLALGHINRSNGCGVTHVVDGDTVTLHCTGKGEQRARIVGIDTPEIKARCLAEYSSAMRAKWMLRRAIWLADDLEINRKGIDRYGRVLVRITNRGYPVGQTLIEHGLAREYSGGQRASWCPMGGA